MPPGGLRSTPMQTTTSQETYAQWLARQMEERNFTQRSLARAWNPGDPETARRALRRYLKGMVPIVRTRLEIARALGSPESEPKRQDADVEGDLDMVAVLRRKVAELSAAVEELAFRQEHGLAGVPA